MSSTLKLILFFIVDKALIIIQLQTLIIH